jgi:hypothetical protein
MRNGWPALGLFENHYEKKNNNTHDQRRFHHETPYYFIQKSPVSINGDSFKRQNENRWNYYANRLKRMSNTRHQLIR